MWVSVIHHAFGPPTVRASPAALTSAKHRSFYFHHSGHHKALEVHASCGATAPPFQQESAFSICSCVVTLLATPANEQFGSSRGAYLESAPT